MPASAILSILQNFAAAIGAVSSLALILDFIQSWRMQRTQNFPRTVRAKVNLKTYEKVVRMFVDHLDENRSSFDIVVGIHYGGIGVAADLAAIRHRPFRLMETRFRTEASVITCEEVIPRYRKKEVCGKAVLLVDNRIRSGRTLSMSKNRLLEEGASSVCTVVLFRPKSSTANADYVIFQAGRWFHGRDFRK